MYNLLYYSKSFRKTTGSFRNCYPDKPNSGYNEQPDGLSNVCYERKKIFYPIKDSESFNYKTKLIGNLPGGSNVELPNIKIIIPLKNLSNFIFRLNFLAINTETELILKWSQSCVLTESPTRNELAARDNAALEPRVIQINNPTDLKFNITDCKLYVPAVTLQEKYDNEVLKD